MSVPSADRENQPADATTAAAASPERTTTDNEATVVEVGR